MTEHLWINVLIVVGIVGTAAEVVRRFVVLPIVRAWVKVERVIDAWNGEPARDGLPARPGIVDRVIAIEAQVKNNGGSSMKDAVDRIEEASTVAASMATATKAALDAHIEQSADILERGERSEREIRDTIATLADAVNVAARSTPPPERDD